MMNIHNLFKKGYFLLMILFLPGVADAQAKNENLITEQQLRQWVSYLASDQMKGRSNGSVEMKEAAQWISSHFREAGLKPVPGSLDFIHEYTYSTGYNTVNERNVVGYIEGSDPRLKDEFIILSAHFDHIGMRRGNTADSVCNGADDNASGTATLIGIAWWLKDSKSKPERSIIIAAFSGEEHGMRGSRNFVANSTVPPGKIYANLNFEMNGHSELLGKKKYYMTGCRYSNLDEVAGGYSKDNGFTLVDSMEIANSLFGLSDNISFSRISLADGILTGIPSGTFATSTFSGYLHNTSDEVELFDFDNMAELVNHFSRMALWLSKNNTRIEWTDPKMRRP